MDSVASFSFWGGGDAGWAGAGFCCLEIMMYNNIFNSIKTKGPSSDQAIALDLFPLSLKCEMNGASQGRGGGGGGGGLYSVIRFWIPTIHTDPQKQSVLLGRAGNMLPACLSLRFVSL